MSFTCPHSTGKYGKVTYRSSLEPGTLGPDGIVPFQLVRRGREESTFLPDIEFLAVSKFQPSLKELRFEKINIQVSVYIEYPFQHYNSNLCEIFGKELRLHRVLFMKNLPPILLHF